jgi:hypothetical protein
VATRLRGDLIGSESLHYVISFVMPGYSSNQRLLKSSKPGKHLIVGRRAMPESLIKSHFVVMRRLGLQRAFTNDSHFRTTGFETCW